MRARSPLLFAALLLCGASARAQDAASPQRGGAKTQAYVFGGPGWLSQQACEDPYCQVTTWIGPQAIARLGGGMDLHVGKGIGVSGEAVYFQRLERHPEGFGYALSLNGTYFMNDAASVGSGPVPFITGGFTFGTFYGPAFNVGGGVNLWGRRRVGLRLETRAHWWEYERIFELRVGINVRPRR
jgi:hypothetical protein